MDRLPPQSGEYWEHFKGNKYWIVGIGRNTETESVDKVIYVESWIKVVTELYRYKNFIVKDSEIDVYYEVFFINDLWLVKSRYQLGVRKSIGWLRDLNNFMEIISSNKTNYYRFNKLE